MVKKCCIDFISMRPYAKNRSDNVLVEEMLREMIGNTPASIVYNATQKQEHPPTPNNSSFSSSSDAEGSHSDSVEEDGGNDEYKKGKRMEMERRNMV